MEWSQVNIPRGVLLPTFAGNFQAYSRDLTFALTQEIQQLWARAETLDTDSNIADGVIETAYIANAAVTTAKIVDLAVTNAKITDCSVDKLTAGTITSKAITLAVLAGTGDTKIQAGKTDFGDTTAGFILGVDDSDSDKAKFEIGNDTNYLKWNGSALDIRGTLNATDIVAGSISADRIDDGTTSASTSAFDSAVIAVDDTLTTLQSVSITTTGKPMFLLFCAYGYGDGADDNLTLYWYVDAIQPVGSPEFILAMKDADSRSIVSNYRLPYTGGTYTVYVKARTSGNTVKVGDRSLIVLELRK